MPQLIYSSVDRHLGCLHVLTLVSGTAVNTGVHVFTLPFEQCPCAADSPGDVRFDVGRSGESPE